MNAKSDLANNNRRMGRKKVLVSLLAFMGLLFFAGCSAPSTAAITTPSPNTSTAPNPTVVEQPVEPTPFGGSSAIAFTSNRDGNFEIYIMDSDGSNQRRLTDSPVDDFFPEFSPSGGLLLYWSYQEGPPLIARLNWILPDGSQQGLFADHVSAWTAWSPDSKFVAYTSGGGKGNLDIYAGYSGGGTPGQLTTDPATDIMPAWSPDGTTIAFVSNRKGGTHIYLMDPDGRNQRRLTKSDMEEREPDWSPDGSRITFASGDDIQSNIYVVDSDGTDIRQLTFDTHDYNENPVWSPDGTMIAFWSGRSGNHDIYVIKIDGSELINLTNHPAKDENPSWSRCTVSGSLCPPYE